MLGAAWQRGQIPLKLSSIERAIDLNGVAVGMNNEAFTWGRCAAYDIAAVERWIRERSPAQIIPFTPRANRTVADIIKHRSEHLVAHTGEALSQRYRNLVERVRQAEAALGGGDMLTKAVAHNYHRLLAEKDEWEVARLHSHPDFRAALEREFEGDFKLHFHIGAWPFAKIDKATGKVLKGEVGPWMMSALTIMARLKRLRGTRLDPFRNNAERKLDRQLRAQYEADLERLLAGLSLGTLAIATKIASLPESVRGYGHVKREQADAAAAARERLWAEFGGSIVANEPARDRA
jgi:indolepyruvate ferredoxin oxidoreductase